MPKVFVSFAALLAATAALAAPPALQRPLPERVQDLLERSQDRPIATYLELTPEQSQRVPMFAAGEALPIFLNRHGGTYYGANDDDSSQNRSTIVSGSSGEVGAFTGSDAQWNAVKSCVQDLFSRFNVVVTDQEPVSGLYVESVIGGEPGDIGMPWGVAGVAPFDPYGCQSIPNAIVYTFSDVYLGSSSYVRDVCETAAQEIAHAFTLDHQMLCEDPMTYLSGCGEKTFQDQYATCGEYEPRECACNGTSQNSVQLLYERLGTSDGSLPPAAPEDGELPTVALLSPDNGAVLSANSVIQVVAEAKDDVGLVAVELLWLFSDESMPCPGQGGAWACSKSGDTYTWSIQVGQGTRPFRVRVRDVVGNVVNSAERSVWLSPDGSGPPDDDYPPEVRIITPREGVPLPADSNIEVVATASDDSGLASVTLMWDYRDRQFPCPYDDGRNTCVVNGSTYTWSIRVRTGSRSFSVKATDLVGNVAETAKRTVALEAGAAPDRPLANDTWDLAAPLGCGDSVTLDAAPGEEDWFDVKDVPAGQNVVVKVSGDVSENLEVTATTGPHSSELFADAEGDPALTFDPPDEDEVRVRVRPYSQSGAYTITIECVVPVAQPNDDGEGVSPSFFGCSSGGDADTSPPSAALLLAFMGLSFLRRKRR